MTGFSPMLMPDGTVRQSGLPKVPRISPPRSAGGIGPVRGVVVATYSYDEPVNASNVSPAVDTPAAIYCDVLIHTSIPGARVGLLRKCIVSQEFANAHEGTISRPRASRGLTIGGDRESTDGSTSPADFSGEHVLVDFIDGRVDLPVILRSLPHPNADLGNATGAVGQRLRLVDADGYPRLMKHQGAFWGVDKDGNFVIDTVRAHKGYGGTGVAAGGGGYDATGNEIPSAEQAAGATGTATSGNQTLQLPANSALTIEWFDPPIVPGGPPISTGRRIRVTDEDGKIAVEGATVDIGVPVALEAAVVGETWEAARQTMNTGAAGLAAKFTEIAAKLTALAGSPTLSGAQMAALAPDFTALATAITTFEAGAATYKSTTVRVSR